MIPRLTNGRYTDEILNDPARCFVWKADVDGYSGFLVRAAPNTGLLFLYSSGGVFAFPLIGTSLGPQIGRRVPYWETAYAALGISLSWLQEQWSNGNSGGVIEFDPAVSGELFWVSPNGFFHSASFSTVVREYSAQDGSDLGITGDRDERAEDTPLTRDEALELLAEDACWLGVVYKLGFAARFGATLAAFIDRRSELRFGLIRNNYNAAMPRGMGAEWERNWLMENTPVRVATPAPVDAAPPPIVRIPLPPVWPLDGTNVASSAAPPSTEFEIRIDYSDEKSYTQCNTDMRSGRAHRTITAQRLQELMAECDGDVGVAYDTLIEELQQDVIDNPPDNLSVDDTSYGDTDNYSTDEQEANVRLTRAQFEQYLNQITSNEPNP